MTVRRGYKEENDVSRDNGSGGSEYKNKSSYGKKDVEKREDAGEDAAEIPGDTNVNNTDKKTPVSKQSDIKIEEGTPKRNGAKKKQP